MYTPQLGLPSASRPPPYQRTLFLRSSTSLNGGRINVLQRPYFCKSLQLRSCSSTEPEQDASQMRAEPARTAWNKGRPMLASTKRKLSQALKQKWKDAEHRASVSAKLKGIEPWNKGRTLSEETRRKMSEAKRNRTATKATRRRMSESHKGKTHTQETARQLSLQLTGQPKSSKHREQIAVGQRRRHAAARVLRAVEAVYEAQGVGSGTGGTGCSAAGGDQSSVTAKVTEAVASAAATAAPRSAKLAAAAEAPSPPAAPASAMGASGGLQSSRIAAYRMASGRGQGGAAAGAGGKGKKQRRLSMAQILGEYKTELQEYRALQDELSPWSTAFLEKNGRKPGMQDVAATGIPWLITRYKQYVLLRDRLFTDTGTLRDRLANAIPEVGSATKSINSASAGVGSLLGAGAAGAGAGSWPGAAGAGAEQRSSAALRFSAAMEYKASRKGGPAAGASAAPAVQNAGQASTGADARDGQADGQLGAAAGGVKAVREAEGEFPLTALLVGDHSSAATGGGLELGVGGSPSQPPAAGAGEEGSLPSLGLNVPPRVKMAMRAAQEYRQKRAQETKAAATAAAAAAKTATAKPSLSLPARLGQQPGAAGAALGDYVPPPKLRRGRVPERQQGPSASQRPAATAAAQSIAEPPGALPASGTSAANEEAELTALLVAGPSAAVMEVSVKGGAQDREVAAAASAPHAAELPASSSPSTPGGGGGVAPPDLVPCSPAPSL